MSDFARNVLGSIRDEAQAQFTQANMELIVYLQSPVGIGEHPDIIEATKSRLAIMTEKRDLIDTVDQVLEKMDESSKN